MSTTRKVIKIVNEVSTDTNPNSIERAHEAVKEMKNEEAQARTNAFQNGADFSAQKKLTMATMTFTFTKGNEEADETAFNEQYQRSFGK